MVAYVPLSTQPVRFNNQFVVGAKIFVYDAGTNTPRTAYADGLAGTEHDWPFLTDANGCIPPFWIVGAAVKVVITTSSGSVIRTIDDIPGETAAATVTPGTGTTIPPGFMMAAHQTGTQTGWVRANGRTIGNVSSGATERANGDTTDLFTVLWNDTLLSVSGGRGASAADDFSANKTIALPDYRCRVPVGLADMGNSTSTRLDGITFATGSKTTLGGTAGAATVALVEANLASHTHTGTTSTASSHTHSASSSSETPAITVSSNGAHTHTATQASHTHTVPTNTNAAADGGGKNTLSGGASTTTSSAQPAITVSTASDHTHTATNAAHSHSVTLASDGAHSHTFTSSASGSGTAHENCQPLITTTIYIKL